MLIRTLIVLCFLTLPALAQEGESVGGPESTAEGPMTYDRFAAIVLALDPEARVAPNGATMTVADVPVAIVLAPGANRMRIMVPIASEGSLTPADLTRLMQANFDTALDARYAIAQGRLWSVFIHPLAELSRDQLISGIGQTVNLASSYGTFYTSGEQIFGRGDSRGIYRDLIEELLERGDAL